MSDGFPGARWWKFDFHTHTPASNDYGKGPNRAAESSVTPREWLLAWMRAGINCVAVTDHNSGEWIDLLSAAADELHADRVSDDCQIVVFPAAEITSNSDIHILTIFGPGTPKATIDELLGAVVLQGKRGEGTAVEKSTIDVAEAVHKRGGLTILAHVDGPSGANFGSGNSLVALLSSGTVDAIEVCDPTAELKAALRSSPLARVLGSDCHHLDGSTGPKCPGSHFTWVKMGTPTLEGVLLALIDGNGASILRCDEVTGDPNTAPAEWIESIEVRDAKVMGNGQAAVFRFSPFLTTLIGGRGTGKSTVIHLMRAALDRDQELQRFPVDAEPRFAFDRFLKVGDRQRSGGLTSDTAVRVILHHASKRFRITWTTSARNVEEWSDGAWAPAVSQAIRERFPVRIFSQGQILEITGPDSTAILDFIDDGLKAADLKKRIGEEETRYLSLRARVRELQQKTASVDTVRAQLDDVKTKLQAFEQSQHASILREHQRRNRQTRELERTAGEASELASRIEEVAGDLELADISIDLFDATKDVEAAAIAEVKELQSKVADAAASLRTTRATLAEFIDQFRMKTITEGLGEHARRAREAYEMLVASLRDSGVADPNEFGQLVQERQRLETELSNILGVIERAANVALEAEQTLSSSGSLRKELWQRRQLFVEETLRGNEYVRITVEAYGSERDAFAETSSVVRSFRERIGAIDERFSEDIRKIMMQLYSSLPLDASARCDEMRIRLDRLRQEIGASESFGGFFRNFLVREAERHPEFFDRIALWSPEDAVRIEYSPGGDGRNFTSIEQGSAGQRSAALLAFFLAYGEEPLLLDQPEDDLDNQLIYDLIVRQLRESKKRRQLLVVTHNPNIVVNGDADLIFAMDFKAGQCVIARSGCLQDRAMREEVCRVMEGGREAFERRYHRLEGRTDVR